MFGVDELGCFPVDARTRGEQVDRVELIATVVALVAAGSVVTADGAGALDVAVGKCTPGGGRHGPLGGVGEDVTVLVQRDEQLLHHVVVVTGGGAGEQVVGQPEGHKVLGDDPVVAVGQIARAQSFLVGQHQDRGAVLVRTTDHQHVVPRHSLKA